MAAAYRDGRLKDEPISYNVQWMQQHNFAMSRRVSVTRARCVPLAAIVVFFLLSLAPFGSLRPRDPKRFFLVYALLLLAGTAAAYLTIWPLDTIDDALGLVSALLVQLLACLTMWNAFYSLLWGFSGSMMFDLFNDPSLLDRERLDRVVCRRRRRSIAFSRGGCRTSNAAAGWPLKARPCGCDRKAWSWRSARSRPSSCFRSGWAGA